MFTAERAESAADPGVLISYNPILCENALLAPQGVISQVPVLCLSSILECYLTIFLPAPPHLTQQLRVCSMFRI